MRERAQRVIGRFEVRKDTDIDITPAESKLHPLSLEFQSRDYVCGKAGIAVDLAQTNPLNDPFKAIVGFYIWAGNGDDAYMEGTVDVDRLEDATTAMLTTIAEARARGIFPPRRGTDASPERMTRRHAHRGIEITAKGRAALVRAKKRGRGK
jgi:hypothetical protein